MVVLYTLENCCEKNRKKWREKPKISARENLLVVLFLFDVNKLCHKENTVIQILYLVNNPYSYSKKFDQWPSAKL